MSVSSSSRTHGLLGTLRKNRIPCVSLIVVAQPYYSGERVSGVLRWTPKKKPVEAFSLRIMLRQVEECTWKERVPGSSDHVRFSGSRVIFEHKVAVWPPGGADSKFTTKRLLPSTVEEFPFSLRLPLEALPTIGRPKNGFEGSITCTLTGYVDSGPVVDGKQQEILSLQILNYYNPPDVLPPPVRIDKMLGTFLKSKAMLSINAQLQHEIVANGEDAVINLTIDNQSPRKVKHIEISLYKSYSFTAQTPQPRFKTFEEFCYSSFYPPDKHKTDILLGPKGQFSRAISFPITEDLPTSNFPSQFIKLLYILKLKVVCNSHHNLCLQAPLVICSPHPSKEKLHKDIPFSFFIPSPDLPSEFNPDDAPQEQYNAATGTFELPQHELNHHPPAFVSPQQNPPPYYAPPNINQQPQHYSPIVQHMHQQ